MALETLKKVWKNEYFQTIITIAILLTFVFGFWHIIQFALGTEYPALAVASTSMVPTLNVGDLIIVQGVKPEQIKAEPLTGDIVVFRKDGAENLIVHRAINKSKINEFLYEFVTKGDNNPGPDEAWNSSMLIGKVVGRIPWMGNLALIMHSQQNIYLFVVILIILIAVLVISPFDFEEEEKGKNKEIRLFGKVSIETIYLLILNILLIAIIIFSLWGTFTFWNPGAGTNQRGMFVTMYGMYSDVQFHKSFSNVVRADISQGFLTYTIDCLTTGGLRTGVPTFSWAQAAIIVLLMLDAWEFIKFLKKKGLKFKTMPHTFP